MGRLIRLTVVRHRNCTSATCMWATVYFVVHEVGSVIPTFGNKLLLFLRFIDHTVELWIGNSNETSLEDFAREINDLGLLERGFEEPSKKVSFLYLTSYYLCRK